MDNYMKFYLHFWVYFTFFCGALSTTNISQLAEIGEIVDFKLNLTELGWCNDDLDYSVLAWNNASYPIAKLENGSTHSLCYNLSFLASVRCSDFNASVIETNVVLILMRVVTKAMAADYIFYSFCTETLQRDSVLISVHLKDTPNTTPDKSPSVLSSTMLSSEPNKMTTGPVKNRTLLPSDGKRETDGRSVVLYALLAAVLISLFIWLSIVTLSMYRCRGACDYVLEGQKYEK